jgi:hydroxymethylglutaryl-CoA lyase
MNPISRPITQTFSSPSIHCADGTALPKMPVMKEKAPAYRKFLNDLPERVTIVEVGARDGLQNETKTVSNHVKIELINRFTQAGIKKIEVGSFVSPDWVPQMAGSAEVLAGITHKEGVEYSVLVPNMKGFKAAVAGEVLPEKMVIFGSASEVFSKKNINCSKAESMERFSEVARKTKEYGMQLRGTVSCAFGFYGDQVTLDDVNEVVANFRELDCDDINIADTIGVATPNKVYALLEHLKDEVPVNKLSMHFHDTYGQGMGNICASLQAGITTFDSSVAGLGGCPYAKGATGNVATEDVLYLLHELGVETGVDLHAVADTGRFILDQLGRKSGSRVGDAILAKREPTIKPGPAKL